MRFGASDQFRLYLLFENFTILELFSREEKIKRNVIFYGFIRIYNLCLKRSVGKNKAKFCFKVSNFIIPLHP